MNLSKFLNEALKANIITSDGKKMCKTARDSHSSNIKKHLFDKILNCRLENA